MVDSAKPIPATFVGCNWQELGRFPGLVPRAVAIGKDGAVLLAADDFSDPSRSALVVLRRAAAGAAWETVDRYLPTGASSTGVRAMHVDADGNVFVLGWELTSDQSRLLLRRSFGAGTAGTWESGETSWPHSSGGALGSDPGGRLYVAHGTPASRSIGWRVESALRGMGAFSLEDEVTFGTAYGAAAPQDFERQPDGTLVVAGQLDGAPDEWVVRARSPQSYRWRTIDRYRLTADAYGLVPRAIVAADDGRLLVAGLGVRGGGSDDYLWLERWQNARGRWRTFAYQLSPGVTSVAQDAAALPGGVAVLGVGYAPGNAYLVLRESNDGGGRWQTALQVSGVTDPWSARLAVDGDSAVVAASVQGAASVLGCAR
jgi:hypothetical protein